MNTIGSGTAVEKHLDQLEPIVITFILASLIVMLASADSSQTFELFGAKITTKGAYGLVLLIFDCLLLLFCSTCWKAGDLLSHCSDAESENAVISVFTHKWLLNPFAYSGEGLLSAVNCAVGPALLMLSWWLGLASLTLLSSVRPTEGLTERILYFLYLALGVSALVAIARLLRITVFLVGSRTRATTEKSHVPPSTLAPSIVAKGVFAFIAGVIGFWIYYSFAHVGM